MSYVCIMELKLKEIVEASSLRKSDIAKMVYPDKPLQAAFLLSRDIAGRGIPHERIVRYAAALGVALDDLFTSPKLTISKSNQTHVFESQTAKAVLDLSSGQMTVLDKKENSIKTVEIQDGTTIRELIKFL